MRGDACPELQKLTEKGKEDKEEITMSTQPAKAYEDNLVMHAIMMSVPL